MSLLVHVSLASDFGGAERQTELLIRGLSRQGLAQRFVGLNGAPLNYRLGSLDGLEVCEASGVLSAARSCGGDAALVHAHGESGVRAAYLRYMLSRTPYIVTRCVTRAPAGFAARRAYRRAASVAAVSRAVARSLSEYEPALDPEVIPGALSRQQTTASRLAEIRERMKGKFVVGHVGALREADKGQGAIIAVARQLSRTHPNIRFVLVGAGPDESMLREQAHGLGNVEFAGHVDDVANYLAVFDLFVFPSLIEGFGAAVLDAMDHGLPVIATRVGGLPELVQHGVGGLLVEPGNADQLAFALLELFQDQHRREMMGRAARERAALYAPERMVNSYRNLYQAAGGLTLEPQA